MTDPTQTIGVNRFRPGRRPDTWLQPDNPNPGTVQA